jgi:RND family efflux transporter MFP subunit
MQRLARGAFDTLLAVVDHDFRGGSMATMTADAPSAQHRLSRLRLALITGAAVLLLAMIGLYFRAAARTNHIALSQSAKPVSTVVANAAEFQPLREYVGQTAPWNEARLGPQYVSAYVATVLFRPGAAVKRGQVLATLDCRFTSASSREIAARAQSVAERQAAVQHEAERVQAIASGGFASVNEVEQLRAKAASERADIESVRANLATKQMAVNDCILRAPFDGDVVERFVDPGAYIRPGEAVLSVADRAVMLVVADAPEDDFSIVAPGTPVDITIDAVHAQLRAPISRRTPKADPATRTVRFEIDVRDHGRDLPVGATARLAIVVGAPERAALVPVQAATLREHKATVFVVVDGIAHEQQLAVLGQRAGQLYVEPRLVGATVVLEGRSLLDDGDLVQARHR